MPEFKLVEAKLHHCGQLVRKLRGEQSRAMAGFGIRSHPELRARFAESSFKKSWKIDGELAAMGGVTGSPLSACGLVWLALSEAATRYPRQTALTARAQLAEMMETRQSVVTLMFPSDVASMRWIRFLRFSLVQDQPDWVPDGMILMEHRKDTR